MLLSSAIFLVGGASSLLYYDLWTSRDLGGGAVVSVGGLHALTSRFTATWLLVTGSAPSCSRYGSGAVVLPSSAILLVGGISNGQVQNEVWLITPPPMLASLPPVLFGLEAVALAYTANSAAVGVTSTLTLSYAASAYMASGSMSVSSGFETGVDVLGCVAVSGIAASFAAISGVCSLSGSAAIASYQAIIRSITYRSTSPTRTKMLSVQVYDGWLASVGMRALLFPGEGRVACVSVGAYVSPLGTWGLITSSAPWATRVFHTTIVIDSDILLLGGQGSTSFKDLWKSSNSGGEIRSTPLLWRC